ncbi:MAG: tRNA (adenosine(37)-N6)-dimethylallyltransferase MiaA [Candidatus Moranbacteria bacterium]|nr:tRNA (adenosine(37)-N6)-dimethylallyltransferase MiaA [Candidatus Moranbacteria bacterium]
MIHNIKKAIAIVGPTAAGKTKLGIALAQKFNGEIVSADSRQVYKHLDISTGKDLKEYGGTPHYLIDIIEPNKEITVADFQKKAFAAIDKIIKKSKLPVIVGGSPFYVYAITEGWQFPKIDKDLVLRKKLNKKSLAELRKILSEIDPKAYKTVDIDNPRRLIRAVEVCTLSGKDFENSKPVSRPRYDFLFLGIRFSNEELKARVRKRTLAQLKEGMVEEVAEVLKKKKASHADLERLGLETRIVSLYLRGRIKKKELADLLIKNVYHFAKRQMVWFGKDKRIKWVNSFSEAGDRVRDFLN